MFLVIEVAETSLDYDHAKLGIYATGGIREVWILDLRGDRIEVYRDASGAGYRDVTIAERGGAVACLAFPDVTLAVNDLLG